MVTNSNNRDRALTIAMVGPAILGLSPYLSDAVPASISSSLMSLNCCSMVRSHKKIIAISIIPLSTPSKVKRKSHILSQNTNQDCNGQAIGSTSECGGIDGETKQTADECKQAFHRARKARNQRVYYQKYVLPCLSSCKLPVIHFVIGTKLINRRRHV